MEPGWKFHHVAVIVADMDKAVDYYHSLGVFTFPPEFMLDSSTYQDYEVYGKKSKSLEDRTRMQFVKSGDFILELVSPAEGKPIHKDVLETQGEGIHHIGFLVDDLAAEIERLGKQGAPVLYYVKQKNGSAFAYFDTSKLGGAIIELIEPARK